MCVWVVACMLLPLLQSSRVSAYLNRGARMAMGRCLANVPLVESRTRRWCHSSSDSSVSPSSTSSSSPSSSSSLASSGESLSPAEDSKPGNASSSSSSIVHTDSDRKSKGKKAKKREASSAFPRSALVECVRTRDYSLAVEIYKTAKESNLLSGAILYSLLSVCYKKDHLDSAITFFREIISFGLSPSEQGYLALIRCYADAEMYEESVSLIKSMQELGIELRHRTFQPLLDAYLRANDVESMLNVLLKMMGLGVHPRSEQLTTLIKACVKLDMTPFTPAVNSIIQECSRDVIGLEYEHILDALRAYKAQRGEGDKEEEVAILVEAEESIPGKIIAQEANGLYYIVQNTSFDISASLESFEDTRVFEAGGFSSNNGSLAADVSQLVTAPKNTTPQYGVSSGEHERNRTETIDFNRADIPLFVEDRYRVRLSANSTNSSADYHPTAACLVDISSPSSRCPNCGATLRGLALSEDTKAAARVALMRIAAAASVNHCKSLETFGIWLEEQPEFKYIIDGANVAYNRQNFGQGRFSYRQIELMVDTLKESGEDRILVLLPQTYVQKVVPNSAKNRAGHRFTQTTADDQRILEKLRAEEMLYVVPSGANDDWYWLYATVAANRTSFAITNDLTRDHRLAFLESRMYVRWRNNHIVHFDLDKALELENDTSTIKLTYPGNEVFVNNMYLTSL